MTSKGASGEKERRIGHYEILETLGKGGYSWVKKGLDHKKKRHVALKFMTRAESSWAHEQAEQVRTEIKSLTQIRHENVMKLFAYNLNAKYPLKTTGKSIATILLVLEYCPGGELFDILYYTDKLDAKTARTYFQMMILGIEACHLRGIAHRDIKPQNLLLDREYQLKLTDFGLSKILDDTSKGMTTTYVGTRGYQAPELLAGKKYYPSCDLFSAGVVLFILLTGYPPFDQADKRDKWYRPLCKNNPAKFWKQHDGCGVDDGAKTLIEGLLAYKGSKRMTISDIKKNKWYNGEVYSKEELKKVLKDRHKLCNEKRKKDANKQRDMQHSVKIEKRDIPDEFAKLKLETPETAERPRFNTLDVVDTDPFSAIWRAKELFEDIYKAKCTLTPDKPFQFEATFADAGQMNSTTWKSSPKLLADASEEEKGDVEATSPTASSPTAEAVEPTPNKYTILASVKTDKDTGKNFVQFVRGPCTGAHAQLKFRKVMRSMMPRIMADDIFRKGWPATKATKETKAPVPVESVEPGCSLVCA